MKKVIIAIIAVTVLAAGAIFVIAQKAGQMGHGGFGGRGGGPMIGMALRGLDLTDDQKAKVKEILDTNKGTFEPLREQLKANHEKLAALGGNFDEGQVTAIAKEQGDLMSQMIVARQKVKSQVFALLTDDQKAKAAEMRQKFQERMKDHKGFGGKRGGGAEF